jgi:hypothetical protein
MWKDALAERRRRAIALNQAVRESTGVAVPSYSVDSAAEISLFPGLTNDESNGHLASSAQSVLHQPKAKRRGEATDGGSKPDDRRH